MKLLEHQQVLDAIPTNWLDSLLSGPDKVVGDPVTNRDIEKVLQGVRARIMALPTMEPCDLCGGLVDAAADACHHCG